MNAKPRSSNSLLTVGLALMLHTTSVSATEVLGNFSFEGANPQTVWSTVAYTGKYNSDPIGVNIPAPANLVTLDFTAVGWYDPILPPPGPLPKAVRVTGRRWHTDGVSQSILSSLPASPNPAGEPYRFHMKIKVDDVCFVRCVLTFSNSTTTGASIIVAEKVIHAAQAGQWVDVDGVKNISWPTAFAATSAQISLDVGQIYKERLAQPTVPPTPPTYEYLPYPSGKWPSYTLDYISMDRDSDLDGLSDAEEAILVPPTLANNGDSDSDGLPDKWEVDHHLLWAPQAGAPAGSSNDRDADPDLDGFTNWQEYWAATDPRSEARFSKPGDTANSNATPAAKAVARMLALVPAEGLRLVGQTVNDPATEYQADVANLAALVQIEKGTARWPAIISLSIESLNTALNISNSAPVGRAYANSGHLVVMKWAMWNPWTLASSGSQGTLGKVDIPALVDPSSANYNLAANVAARAVWMPWLDAVAAEFAKFIDPDLGGHPDNVIIFRPMSEMTGDWNWYGHRTREEYLALWHFIFDYYTNTKHLNHLLWCHESAQSEHHYLIENGGIIKPGLNVNATPASDGITTGNSNTKPVPADYYYPGDEEVDIMGHNLYDNDWVLPNDLNAVFRSYPKIYAFPQAGVSTNKTTAILFDNLNYPNRIAASFPRASFFIPWSTFTTNGGSVTVHHAIRSNPNASLMMTDPRIITDSWMTAVQQWERNTHSPFTLPLSLNLTSNRSASNATYTIEASNDLIFWQPAAQAVGSVPWTVLPGFSSTPGNGGSVIFTDSALPEANPRRFLRLNVSEL